MAKVSFASMKLKTNDDVNTITIGEKTIEVKQYLPIEDKNNLIEISIQMACGGTIFNPLLFDAYFHTYLVIEYTNINFTENQKSDILKLYDILESNDVITSVIQAIPEHEYMILYNNFKTMTQETSKYMISAKAIADDLLQYAPMKSEEISENVANFDITKFSEIMRIAKDTNMDLGING